MQLPDTLSRAYLPIKQTEDSESVSIVNFISISNQRYQEIHQRIQQELEPLLDTVLNGWPETRQNIPRSLFVPFGIQEVSS